jgi:hypothetical protein
MRLKEAVAGFLVLALAFPAICEKREPNAAFKRKLARDKQIVHALNRLTFGATAAAVEEVRRKGLDRWIEEQFNPTRMPENPELEGRLHSLESIHLSSAELMRKFPPPQRIVAYATGRLPMPIDPEEREIVEHLSER